VSRDVDVCVVLDDRATLPLLRIAETMAEAAHRAVVHEVFSTPAVELAPDAGDRLEKARAALKAARTARIKWERADARRRAKRAT
jgi:hypothetical protein